MTIHHCALYYVRMITLCLSGQLVLEDKAGVIK